MDKMRKKVPPERLLYKLDFFARWGPKPKSRNTDYAGVAPSFKADTSISSQFLLAIHPQLNRYSRRLLHGGVYMAWWKASSLRFRLQAHSIDIM